MTTRGVVVVLLASVLYLLSHMVCPGSATTPVHVTSLRTVATSFDQVAVLLAGDPPSNGTTPPHSFQPESMSACLRDMSNTFHSLPDRWDGTSSQLVSHVKATVDNCLRRLSSDDDFLADDVLLQALHTQLAALSDDLSDVVVTTTDDADLDTEFSNALADSARALETLVESHHADTAPAGLTQEFVVTVFTLVVAPYVLWRTRPSPNNRQFVHRGSVWFRPQQDVVAPLAFALIGVALSLAFPPPVQVMGSLCLLMAAVHLVWQCRFTGVFLVAGAFYFLLAVRGSPFICGGASGGNLIDVSSIPVLCHSSAIGAASLTNPFDGTEPPPPRQCPVPHVLLHSPVKGSGAFVQDPHGMAALEQLQRPLTILSDLGPMNTGKSLRQSLIARLLTGEGEYSHCPDGVGFQVRHRWKDTAAVGKSRGLMFLAIRVSDVPLDGLPPELRQAVKGMNPDGTIVLLDPEGADEPGQNRATARTLQLITIAASSVTSFALTDHVGQHNLKEIGLFANLLLSVEKQLSGIADCTVNSLFEDDVLGPGSGDGPAHRNTYASVPKAYIMPKDTTGLLSALEGITYNPDGSLRLLPNATLDGTQLLQDALEKELALNQTAMMATMEGISSHFGSATYVVNLVPRERLPSRLAFACPPELDFFEDNNSRGLPRCWSCGEKCGYGLTYGMAHFTLPMLLSHPPKVIDGAVADGKALASFIRRMLEIDYASLEKLLTLESAEAAEQVVCSELSGKVHRWIAQSDSQLRDELPIEDTSCRSLDTDNLCREKDFKQWWAARTKDIWLQVCAYKALMPEASFGRCLGAVSAQMSAEYAALLKENVKRCTYTWRTGPLREDQGCLGSCPGYRGRLVECVNVYGVARVDHCCRRSEKPTTTVPCEVWTHKWMKSDWSECDNATCGMQTRDVSCMRCNDRAVNESYCAVHAEKPASEQRCEDRHEWKRRECTGCPCGRHETCNFDCIRCGKDDDPRPHSECQAQFPKPTTRYCGPCPTPSPKPTGCFGLEQHTQLSNGSSIALAAVRAGDRLMAVDPDTHASAATRVVYTSASSPFLAFTSKAPMVRIRAQTPADGHSVSMPNSTDIVLTPDHLMFRSPHPCSSPATVPGFELVPACDVRPGDSVLLVLSPDPEAQCATVVRVSHTVDTPLVLLTAGNGNVVVSGVAASSFTTGGLLAQRLGTSFLEWLQSAVFGPSCADWVLTHLAVIGYEWVERIVFNQWCMTAAAMMGVGFVSVRAARR